MDNIYLLPISNFAKLDFDIENIFALPIVFGDFYLPFHLLKKVHFKGIQGINLCDISYVMILYIYLFTQVYGYSFKNFLYFQRYFVLWLDNFQGHDRPTYMMKCKNCLFFQLQMCNAIILKRKSTVLKYISDV